MLQPAGQIISMASFIRKAWQRASRPHKPSQDYTPRVTPAGNFDIKEKALHSLTSSELLTPDCGVCVETGSHDRRSGGNSTKGDPRIPARSFQSASARFKGRIVTHARQ